MNLEPGSAAEWANAFVTMLALAAAFWAGLTSLRVFRLEQKREDRADEAEMERRHATARAEQADSVAAWYVASDKNDGRLQNTSPLPVYDVRVIVSFHDGRRHVEHIPVLAPGKRWLGMPDDVMHPDDVEDADYLKMAITFRDTRGRLWHRDEQGVLHGPDSDVVVPDATGPWDTRFTDEWGFGTY